MKLTIRQGILHPILKYPGGKLREWKIIKSNLPNKFNNYYEPFVGGGSTWLNVFANHYYINDLSTDLMNLYIFIQNKHNRFIKFIKFIIKAWDMPYMANIVMTNPDMLLMNKRVIDSFINDVLPHLFSDVKFFIDDKKAVKAQLVKSINIRIQSLRHIKKNKGQPCHLAANAVTTVKSAVYTLLRTTYNKTHDQVVKTAIYWYLREYSYSSMFRFNAEGDFNVPFGGLSYDSKSLRPKLYLALSNRFQSKLHNTTLMNYDFYKALKLHTPESNDFVFLDPPYDTSFSTYDGNKFGKDKQIKLAIYLKNQLKSKFMLIIKSSRLINNLYHDNENVIGGRGRLKIYRFNKHYQVSFQNRNNKNTNHLLIMNY